MKNAPIEFKDGIIFNNNKYWFSPIFVDGATDFNYGTIYRLTKDEILSGVINGTAVGMVSDGIVYKF